MTTQVHELSDADFASIVDSTAGYSGADIKALCTEAAMGPIRSIKDIRTITASLVRPISLCDFKAATRQVGALHPTHFALRPHLPRHFDLHTTSV
jgi:SpoVK/Ycf46/Vps4 family AAA+-type ATPase